MWRAALVAACGACLISSPLRGRADASRGDTYLFDDAHFHLTNYVQKGPSAREYVKMMGSTVKRSTLFGIPLQQTWSDENSGPYAPTYYLQSDAPLYYYSFTDAWIAMAYRSLSPETLEDTNSL